MTKKLPVCVTLDEFKLLMAKTKHIHHKVAFILGFGAGLRIFEISNLEKRDIDFKNKKILVREGKGSKDRIVPLPKGLKQSHLSYIPIKCGIRSLQRAFKKSCHLANLLVQKPTLHFHSLRHGFATRSIEQGIPIHHIRTLLGHSNIATTNIYLIANPQDALKSYDELF